MTGSMTSSMTSSMTTGMATLTMMAMATKEAMTMRESGGKGFGKLRAQSSTGSPSPVGKCFQELGVVSSGLHQKMVPW